MSGAGSPQGDGRGTETAGGGQRAGVHFESPRRLARIATGCTQFSRPGRPTDNAFVESFNGHFRQECLDQHWFASLEEARQIIEAWRIEYNTERPHQALQYGTPTDFAAAWEPPTRRRTNASSEPIPVQINAMSNPVSEGEETWWIVRRSTSLGTSWIKSSSQ